MLFKTLRVRGRCPSERRVDGVRVPHTQVKRIVDKEANALVYVSYSTRINKDDDSNKARFASSLCTVSMD